MILKKSILSFVAVLAVIALLSCTAAFGLNVGPLSIASVMDEEDGIRRGLDLVGGSSITFEAILKDDYNKDNLSSDMASVQAMLQKRLDSLGYTEATVELVGDNRVTVDIPSINNPEEAVSVLGATAQLTFEDADGNVILDGSGIKSATSGYGQISQSSMANEHYVQVTFTSEAQEKWTEATKAAANAENGKNYIAIKMDDEVLSQPSVSSEYAQTGITGDSCVISGSFTADSAKTTAARIYKIPSNCSFLRFSISIFAFPVPCRSTAFLCRAFYHCPIFRLFFFLITMLIKSNTPAAAVTAAPTASPCGTNSSTISCVPGSTGISR